jgi:hypothetical protein
MSAVSALVSLMTRPPNTLANARGLESSSISVESLEDWNDYRVTAPE